MQDLNAFNLPLSADTNLDLITTDFFQTVQNIAECLDSDTSLCNFQASCRSAREAIEGDNFSLWRRRYISNFEPTGWDQSENSKYKKAYHDQRKVLKNGAIFVEGRSLKERTCLNLMKELIVGE